MSDRLSRQKPSSMAEAVGNSFDGHQSACRVCSEEVKLLLSPQQVQSAITALKARQETHGRVYFYDTPALDLLSKGHNPLFQGIAQSLILP